MCQALFKIQHKMRTEWLLPQTIWWDQISTIKSTVKPNLLAFSISGTHSLPFLVQYDHNILL